MSEYTAHVQMPDGYVGLELCEFVINHDAVVMANLQMGNGTWLSFGVVTEHEYEAIMAIGRVRRDVSLMESKDPELNVWMFEHTPMLVTCGRTVVYSEGV